MIIRRANCHVRADGSGSGGSYYIVPTVIEHAGRLQVSSAQRLDLRRNNVWILPDRHEVSFWISHVTIVMDGVALTEVCFVRATAGRPNCDYYYIVQVIGDNDGNDDIGGGELSFCSKSGVRKSIRFGASNPDSRGRFHSVD